MLVPFVKSQAEEVFKSGEYTAQDVPLVSLDKEPSVKQDTAVGRKVSTSSRNLMFTRFLFARDCSFDKGNQSTVQRGGSDGGRVNS